MNQQMEGRIWNSSQLRDMAPPSRTMQRFTGEPEDFQILTAGVLPDPGPNFMFQGQTRGMLFWPPQGSNVPWTVLRVSMLSGAIILRGFKGRIAEIDTDFR